MRLRPHPSRRTLLAYDAGELGGRRTRRVADHLTGCHACRGSLVWQRDVRAAVSELTSPPAPDVLGRIRERQEAGESVLLPAAAPGSAARRRPRRRAVLWAGAALVALVVLAGSGVAAVRMLDLAPLPAWLGGAAAPAPAPAAPPVLGVDVPVPPSGLEVGLDGAGEDVTLAVEAGEGDLVQVTVAGAGTDALFRVGTGRLEVRGVETGEVRLIVPRNAAGPVTVTTDGRHVAIVQGGQVRLRGRPPSPGDRARLRDLLGNRAGGGRG